MTPSPLEPATELLARPASAHPPIETLVALHERDVRSAIRRVFGRSQEEDDLVQEVFTRLVVRLRQPGELCVGAWVRGVAHNLAVDEIRRRRPVPVEDVLLDRPVSSSVEEEVAGADLYGRVAEAAYGLPDRQRAALAAALAGGAPGVAGVASQLGVSVHAAESLLSRARVGLRNHLAASADSEVGSTRPSMAAVLAGVVAALGLLLRRWRATAAVTAMTAVTALTGVAVVPAVLENEVEDRPPAVSPAPPDPSTAPGAGPDVAADGPAGEVDAEVGGDSGGTPDEAPGPHATAAPRPPETPVGDPGHTVATIVDAVTPASAGEDLEAAMAGACAVTSALVEAVPQVGELADAAGARPCTTSP